MAEEYSVLLSKKDKSIFSEFVMSEIKKVHPRKDKQLFTLGMWMYKLMGKCSLEEQVKLHNEFKKAYKNSGGLNYCGKNFNGDLAHAYRAWVRKQVGA